MKNVRIWIGMAVLSVYTAGYWPASIYAQEGTLDLPAMDQAMPGMGQEVAFRELAIAGADGAAHVLRWDETQPRVAFKFAKELRAGAIARILAKQMKPTDRDICFVVKFPGDTSPSDRHKPDQQFRGLGLFRVALKKMVEAEDAEQIVISLGIYGDCQMRFLVNGADMGGRVDALRTKLFLLRRQIPNARVVIESHPGVTWDCLTQALNATARFGFRKIAMRMGLPNGKRVKLFEGETVFWGPDVRDPFK